MLEILRSRSALRRRRDWELADSDLIEARAVSLESKVMLVSDRGRVGESKREKGRTGLRDKKRREAETMEKSYSYYGNTEGRDEKNITDNTIDLRRLKFRNRG